MIDFASLQKIPVIDAHIHLPFPALVPDLEALTSEMSISRVNLVSTPDVSSVTHNPAVIAYKYAHPQTAYICGGLDHFSVQLEPSRMPQALAQQIDSFKSAGFDGLKLLESKPIARKMINIPLDGPIYAPMWEAVVKNDLPVVWHVADPEEFWDFQKCPDWVKKAGWFYGDGTYPLKEALYSEVEAIVARHPELKVILAHFFFLSADLPRAAAFLDAHPNVCFDLTPGSEMFFNFSTDLQAARDFFIRFQDRLIFGTDSGASAVGHPGQPLNRAETLGRTYFVRTFLEKDGALEIPGGVSHWERPGITLNGLGLPEEVLKKIYAENFIRLFGEQPALLNRQACLQMLEFQTDFIDKRAGTLVESPARKVLQLLNTL